ncbi:MAG: Single-stranded-DNA-specific exonuclease RecJ [Patescibacteria group bacterium]|nr:Single-stranded-DNA-specific exonuclease RecJ [Patescibacteria group bacterium]
MPDTTYPFTSLAGAGVAFKLLCAVASKAFAAFEYESKSADYVDFAALGTVADMMPLVGENRTIVSLGLARIKKSRSSGLRKLCEGKEEVADLIGFHIGPRINAAGRMDTPYTALKLLLAADDRVDALMAEIEDLNARRKSSTEYFLNHAMQVTDATEGVAFYESDAIEHGIIGLIAGRLCEAFAKPSIALKREEGKLVASCRAPEGFDMVEFLTEFKDSFLAFGGHKQAAGFSISIEKFDDFRARASARAHEIRAGITVGERSLKADMALEIGSLSEGFVKEIRSYGPYGMAFPKPVFFFKDVRAKVEKLGKDGKHFKLVSSDFSGKINAFGFGQFEKELLGRERFDLVCEVEIERWMGRSGIVLTVKDFI